MSGSRRPEVIALGIVGAVLLLIALALAASCRPLPALAVEPVQAPLRGATNAGAIPWPADGQGALGVVDAGLLASSNDTQPVPLASVVKAMTALVIMDAHPLKPGETGPTVTVIRDDVVEFLREAGEDESVVGVQEGETLSQLQLLQGLLIPSANNFAYILARWDAGGVPAFVQKMNAKAQALGMTQTKYVDASGIGAANVGTASDQVRLGLAFMKDPLLAAIVDMQDVTLPFAGKVMTTNQLLGTHDIVGLKTGNTDEAGGCLVFAATKNIGGQPRVVVGAVLKQKTLQAAFTASSAIVDRATDAIKPLPVLDASITVATITAPWGANTALHPAEPVTVLAWAGATPKVTTEVAAPYAPIEANADLGTITVELGQQRVTTHVLAARAVPKPGFFWRVFRH